MDQIYISDELKSSLQKLENSYRNTELIKQRLDTRLTLPMKDSVKAGLYFLCMATLQRSNSLVYALTMLLCEKNFYAAIALPRLQMDGLLRVFGFCGLKEKSEYLACLKQGGLAHFKKSNGKRITDAYLYKELSSKAGYEWATQKYKKYCEGIHLSDSLMHAMLSNINLADRSGSIEIKPMQNYLPEKTFVDIADDFYQITDALFAWIDTAWNCLKDSHDPS